MPEGPELHHAGKFINQVCRGRVFSGKIVKSEVHKSDEVQWDHGDYSVSATSRGKELKMTITAVGTKDDSKGKSTAKKPSLDIMIQFGMSGKFHFCDVDEMEKHSHLNFYTKTEDGGRAEVLSFVDYRRFGRWYIGADWSPDRGPCVLLEYPAFRENVLNNLKHSAFNKPICETLLNQKFFNGIGNYLRAEILYRCGVRPFECARTVLEKLLPGDGEKVKVKSENPDILQLCTLLPQEVVNLGANGYINNEKTMTTFTDWLQCYYNPVMKNMSDHNKRTIWFTGDPGPMVPSERKTKGVKKGSTIVKRKTKQMIDAGEELPEMLQSPPKKKKLESPKITRKKLKEKLKEENEEKPKAKIKPEKIKKSKESVKPTKVKIPKTKAIKQTLPKSKDVKRRKSNSNDKSDKESVNISNGKCKRESELLQDYMPARRLTRSSSKDSTNSSTSSSSSKVITNAVKSKMKRKAMKS